MPMGREAIHLAGEEVDSRQQAADSRQEAVMKILLDPGHGGDQPGAMYNGVEEEDVTLAVGLRCANVLRDLGHDVFLTRDRDTGIPLVERVRLMNEYKCEAFVSIHCNASALGEKANGVETYYRDREDKPLAACIQNVFSTYTGRKDVGLFQDELRLKKRLAVLNNDKVPCALVELGYLSNPSDREYLIDNISTAGEILAHAIDWFAHIKEGRVKEAWPV
jgi:N-acetylmuramoyl-L-alanine amidase